MSLKSGVKSSEFLVTLVTQLVSFSVLSGLIGPQDVGDITDAIVTIITSTMALVTALAYIRGRIELKMKQTSIDQLNAK